MDIFDLFLLFSNLMQFELNNDFMSLPFWKYNLRWLSYNQLSFKAHQNIFPFNNSSLDFILSFRYSVKNKNLFPLDFIFFIE